MLLKDLSWDLPPSLALVLAKDLRSSFFWMKKIVSKWKKSTVGKKEPEGNQKKEKE